MTESAHKPIIFLAFANDRNGTVGQPLNLPEEERRVRQTLEAAQGHCEFVSRSNCTADDIFKVLQDVRYRDRIAIFHFSGHANSFQLLLETRDGQTAAADASGLASFLAAQHGLQLVFLNGCSTRQQAQGLLDANKNLAAVIATSVEINDDVAIEFSERFYAALAQGITFRRAFNEASAGITTTRGTDRRKLYFGDAQKDVPDDNRDISGAPWNLYEREGAAELVDKVSLLGVANDPLFGLPPLDETNLPESPYKHLNWFTSADAEIFFGRGRQIREMYDALTSGSQPITLFYGQSGVGKSSLLDAGLLPRLTKSCEVRYARRGDKGLLTTLKQALGLSADDATPIETAWRASEVRLGKPLSVILDQVEECYTRPIPDLPDELAQLLRAVEATFSNPAQRPLGRLVLSFREEWLARLEDEVRTFQLPRTKSFLKPLDRAGIIEVVQGPTSSRRLRERYALTIDDGLAEEIADDLLADRGSAIATTLQILLSKLWEKATESRSEPPKFTRGLYLDLKRDGILLGDFFKQQLQAFEGDMPEPARSGLLLDVLAQHTTSLGTANQCRLTSLSQQYGHVGQEFNNLLLKCQDLYLLSIVDTSRQEEKSTRLVHDILAPIVRQSYDASDRPGQRARRILEANHAASAGLNTPERNQHLLGKIDLKLVEEGIAGTRQWTEVERQLILDSQKARRSRVLLGRTLTIAFLGFVLSIVILSGVLYRQLQITTEARVSLTAQKSWGNRRINFFRTVLRSTHRELKGMQHVLTSESASLQLSEVRSNMGTLERELVNAIRGKALIDGERISVPRIYFATTRRLEAGGVYGEQINPDALDFGYCDVSIPETHAFGALESPLPGHPENILQHVILQATQQTNMEEFRQLVAVPVPQSQGRILLIVHSWNTGFDEAVRRAAEMVNDMELDLNGETVLFSWPGGTEISDYFIAQQRLEYSSKSFVRTLECLTELFGDGNVDILALGLGSKLAVEGCMQWLDKDPGRRLGHIVLLSPDVDPDIFRRQSAKLLDHSKRITAYIIPEDPAIAVASAVTGNVRLGTKIFNVPGVDEIEVSGLGSLGVSFEGRIAILRDVRTLLRDQLTPEGRNLKPIGNTSASQPDRGGHFRLSLP